MFPKQPIDHAKIKNNDRICRLFTGLSTQHFLQEYDKLQNVTYLDKEVVVIRGRIQTFRGNRSSRYIS